MYINLNEENYLYGQFEYLVCDEVGGLAICKMFLIYLARRIFFFCALGFPGCFVWEKVGGWRRLGGKMPQFSFRQNFGNCTKNIL